jgi:hypothetical protein
MMRLLGLALGEDRILGDKFPQERARSEFAQRRDGETESQYTFRLYADSLLHPHDDEATGRSRDLNPNGFWECPFTVRGVRFSVGMESKLKDLESEVVVGAPRETICKVVSQGLAQSDPRYISKIIFMVRDPRSVARSQERLRREMKFRTEDGQEHDLYEGQVVHTPRMFIDVTIGAMLWMDNHPDVPVLFVRYDDLVAQPQEPLRKVAEFLGDGDWEAAIHEIDPKLKRSYPQEVKSNLWGDAEFIYKALLDMDVTAVRGFLKDPRRMSSREARSWPCLRCEAPMVEPHCLQCKANNNGFRDSLISFADERGIPWRERPCAFETAFDLDNPLISIEESIDQNFWDEPGSVVAVG